MRSLTTSSLCIILRQAPSGESYICNSAISAEKGVIYILSRASSKQKSKIAIDLFDEGVCSYEQKSPSSAAFLNSFELETKRTGIAKNYTAFATAAYLAQVVLLNPLHETNSDAIYRLIQKSLARLEESFSPKAIAIKFLYVFCKDEGYPILQEWYNGLSKEDASTVSDILNSPLAQQHSDPNQFSHALDSIQRYIRQHTHIRLPNDRLTA